MEYKPDRVDQVIIGFIMGVTVFIVTLHIFDVIIK